MNELIQPFVDALQGDQGLVLQAAAWMTAFRLTFKLFSERIQALLTRAVAHALETSDPADDELLRRVFACRTYRVLALLVDWFFSIKLPTALP